MLLQALEGPQTRQQLSKVLTLPAPLRGWNTRDKYALKGRKDILFAPILVNWIIADGKATIRPGIDPWATGLPAANIESLLVYRTLTGTSTLFAAVGTEIYNVTASGAVGAAVLTGLTNAQWQHVIFSTTGGHFLVAVNGADGVRTWNGSAWASQVITNVTAANLINVAVHQNRLWFVEKNTLNAWYLPVFAVTGAASVLRLGAICKRGGFLVAIHPWTHDSGSGPDDYLAFVTSEGEVAIYQGVDPNSIMTFGLVGVFTIAKPLGKRCMTKVGGDVAILTESGLVELSHIMGSDKADEITPLSDPIRDNFVNAANAARNVFGWEVLVYPRRGWVIVNVPTLQAGQFVQYVFNPLMQAWFMLESLGAVCWAVSDNGIYAGRSGAVYRWDNGTTSDAGSNINADIGFAWWNYGVNSLKQFTLLRTHFLADGQFEPRAAIRYEFDESPATELMGTIGEATGSFWDDPFWDEADWSGDQIPVSPWLTIDGTGLVAAPRLLVAARTAIVTLVAIDVAWEQGGII